jgi:hypothetical protein
LREKRILDREKRVDAKMFVKMDALACASVFHSLLTFTIIPSIGIIVLRAEVG